MDILKFGPDLEIRELFVLSIVTIKMMTILRKIMLGIAVISACAVARVAWSEVDTHIVVQPNQQTVQQLIQFNPQAVQHIIETKPHHAVQSGKNNKKAPFVTVNIRHQPGKPVDQPRTQQRGIEQASVIRMIQTGSLLIKPISSDPVKINFQQSNLAESEKTGSIEAADGLGLDIGNGLPLPMPDSILIAPQDRPAGFHVGLDYHLDQKWALTGLAGVKTTGGIVTSPAKPSVNQVGVRASYRF